MIQMRNFSIKMKLLLVNGYQAVFLHAGDFNRTFRKSFLGSNFTLSGFHHIVLHVKAE